MKLFGSSHSAHPASIDWSSLLSLLEDDDQRAAIQQIYPGERRESFLGSLRRIAAEASKAGESVEDLSSVVRSSGRQLQTAEQLVNWPTVAVAGMLNSGKTSLVATFLSEHGRRRTLRGNGNHQGTHRFVLWLPSQWEKDSELYGLLMQRIGDAIGRPPEMLSDDIDEAHDQYNNRDGHADLLSVPLVGTDPLLDEVGIGLLDCPDIVSDEAFGLGSPEQRRQILGKAATLCSAFLVVSSAESSRDATLGNLLRVASDLMPGIPRMLAVNKIRPRQTPDQVFETFDPLARAHGIETVYAAYDFEIPGSRPYIPAPEDVIARAMDPETDSLPVFFSIRSVTEENPPAAIDDDRMLQALPGRLDRGVLFESFRYSLENGLRRSIWDHGFHQIDKDADRSVKQTAMAQRCLLGATLDFFAHREIGVEIAELRLHQSERIIRQLSESFAITAPWYARWGVRMNAKLRGMFGGAGNFLRNLTPSAIAQRTADDLKGKFRSGDSGAILTPARLIQAIERHGGSSKLTHWSPISHGGSDSRSGDELEPDQADVISDNSPKQGEWIDAAEAAILRFERDDFTSLDPRRLDEAVRQMWDEIPRGKKLLVGLTPLGALLATFGGVLAIPLDFGSTLIASASMSELFIAGGLTAFATAWAGKQNTRNVEQQAARQQVADFQAVLCDTFGVARVETPPKIEVGGKQEKLPPPKIIARSASGPALTLYKIREEFKQDLQKLLPRN
jgi:hypothetical protein